MKFLLLSLTLVTLLFSCGKSDQEISAELHRKIQGDWYFPQKAGGPFHEHFFFSFEDSIVANQYADYYHQYVIKSDTLMIHYKNPYRRKNHHTIKKYKIIHIGKNGMKLVTTKERDENSTKQSNDTLYLKKMHPKNNIKPKSIGFYIVSTFGTIRPTYIEIKSNREINFFVGLDFNTTSKKGILSRQEYNEILRCLHNLPFNSLKDRYETGATDQVEYALNVNYDNKQKHIDSYGLEGTPAELQVLFTKLYLLPTKCQLEESKAPLTPDYFWERNIVFHWDSSVKLLPPIKLDKN